MSIGIFFNEHYSELRSIKILPPSSAYQISCLIEAYKDGRTITSTIHQLSEAQFALLQSFLESVGVKLLTVGEAIRKREQKGESDA